jgi:tryptophanyl-tRNA synthetase
MYTFLNLRPSVLNINDSEININFIICNFSLNNKKLYELCNQEKNTMAKILTGVQSTGTPHLGNLLGAIIPAIQLSNDPKMNHSFSLPIYIPLPK